MRRCPSSAQVDVSRLLDASSQLYYIAPIWLPSPLPPHEQGRRLEGKYRRYNPPQHSWRSCSYLPILSIAATAIMWVLRSPTNDLETVCVHLSAFAPVGKASMSRWGNPIALGGNTGRSSGPLPSLRNPLHGPAINPCAIFDLRTRQRIRYTYTFDKRTYQRYAVTYSPSANSEICPSVLERRTISTLSASDLDQDLSGAHASGFGTYQCAG